MNFALPRNIKGLWAFLGLTRYYHMFSPASAKKTEPQLKLTKKRVKWMWEEYHQQAFKEVNALLVKYIMLHHPQEEELFVIYVDASDYTVGSALHQKNEDGAASDCLCQ